MHPALSVIFFTVTSGAGYGLFCLLVLVNLFTAGGLTRIELLTGSTIALVLISAGLVSSTFHLANPKNAWRAFSRFRTSWLAREGILAIAFYPFAMLYIFFVWENINMQASIIGQALSLAVALLAMATVFSTGMIYACLKTISQWNTALTPLNYMALGLMLGSLLLTGLQEGFGHGSSIIMFLSILLIIVAFIVKLVYFFWMRAVNGPTINTATSFTRATVRILDVGHTAGTFLTEEFGYFVARNKLLLLRYFMLTCAFVIPLILMISRREIGFNSIATYCALLLAFIGVFVERWLFFAEARHVVNLYHGMQNVQGKGI